MKLVKRVELVRNRPNLTDYESEYRLAIQKLWPDLLVKVEERIFSTHRHLLIHYCEYFKDFFSRVYDQYPDQRKAIMTLALSDFSSASFARILNWMYTGSIDLANDNVAEIFLIAKHFGIAALISKTSEFAQNYMKTYVDFYEMCCQLAPMAPTHFYASLEQGYLSPFSCDDYLDNVKEFIFDPLPYKYSAKELHYSKEWKEFNIQFDLNGDVEVLKYPPLNCTPIPLTTLNVLSGKCLPKPTLLKSQYIDKKAKYVTAIDGKTERKKSSKITSGNTGISKIPEKQQKEVPVSPSPGQDKSSKPAPPPPPSSKLKTTALPVSRGTKSIPTPPPLMENSSAAKSLISNAKSSTTPNKEQDKHPKSSGSTPSQPRAPPPTPPAQAQAKSTAPIALPPGASTPALPAQAQPKSTAPKASPPGAPTLAPPAQAQRKSTAPKASPPSHSPVHAQPKPSSQTASPPEAHAKSRTTKAFGSKVATPMNEPSLDVETVKAAKPLETTPPAPTNPDPAAASGLSSAPGGKPQQKTPVAKSSSSAGTSPAGQKAPPVPPPLPPALV